jgi:hypothetical protein
MVSAQPGLSGRFIIARVGSSNARITAFVYPAILIFYVKFAGMIARTFEKQVIELLKSFPAVGIIGPRQVGKTTLAKALQKTHS